MRRALLAVCCALACQPGAEHQQRPALVGRIFDAQSGRPLAGAVLFVYSESATTDRAGRYTIPQQSFVNADFSVVVEKAGYLPQHFSFPYRRGTTETRDIRLLPSPVPCCSLVGAWTVRLRLDSLADGFRSDRELQGTFEFHDSLSTSGLSFYPPQSDQWHSASPGLASFDFSLFFGAPIVPGTTTSVGPVDERFGRELTGVVFAGDSLIVRVVPRCTHCGFVLKGKIDCDSATGVWSDNGHSFHGGGRFVMKRGR